MSSRNTVIGVAVIAVVMAVLAILAFTQQQQAANNEATAIANAQAANASADEANAARETAVAQANDQATAQAEAEAAQADAEAAQAEAESTRAAAEQSSTEQAGTAAAALDEAASQATAAAVAQAEAEQQGATAEALTVALAEAGDNLATQQAGATEVAATAAAQQSQAEADAAAAQADRDENEANMQATIVALEGEIESAASAAAADAAAAAALIADLEEQLANVPEVVIEPTAVPDEPDDNNNSPFGSIDPGGSGDDVELDATFTTANRVYSVSHPRTWLAFEGDAGQIFLLTSEDAAQDVIPPNEMYIIIEGLLLEDLAAGQNINPMGGIEVFLDFLRENNSSLRFSPAEQFRLGSFDAARSYAATEGYDLEVIVFGIDNSLMLVRGFCAPGEGDECEAMLTTIAKTIVYNP